MRSDGWDGKGGGAHLGVHKAIDTKVHRLEGLTEQPAQVALLSLVERCACLHVKAHLCLEGVGLRERVEMTVHEVLQEADLRAGHFLGLAEDMHAFLGRQTCRQSASRQAHANQSVDVIMSHQDA